MELIDQHTKAIMEECKLRARDAGLTFEEETLEYIVTNKDLIELSPKVMIPTLYDYWVHDVEVIQGHGRYKLYPSNPYETVINSRPAISFYNDNNPDWMNIMIFYHVLAHVDFFQNNIFFEDTWTDDFVGQALSDKRMVDGLRGEHGRWLDYIIEFSRGIDNLCGYYHNLRKKDLLPNMEINRKLEFYFDQFLQNIEKAPSHEIYKEVERFNELIEKNRKSAEQIFFREIQRKYPEFGAIFEREQKEGKSEPIDVMEFIRDHSPFIRREENQWIRSVMDVVRNTALYFEPQIRTKILNEGWASYWHDKLFRQDDRIRGHEVAFAKANAQVTSISRVGLNPYAIGLRLIQYVEDLSNKGKMEYHFQVISSMEQRDEYNHHRKNGRNSIFTLRKNFSDFMIINTFVNQEFVDLHDLFVAGRRLNEKRRTYEYYVKSRKAEDYKEMLLNSLYHPPKVQVDPDRTSEETLYLVHEFEGKQLVRDFIPETMMGIEYLWGGSVQLETTEINRVKSKDDPEKVLLEEKRILYTMKDRKLTRKNL